MGWVKEWVQRMRTATDSGTGASLMNAAFYLLIVPLATNGYILEEVFSSEEAVRLFVFSFFVLIMVAFGVLVSSRLLGYCFESAVILMSLSLALDLFGWFGLPARLEEPPQIWWKSICLIAVVVLFVCREARRRRSLP